MVEHVPGGLRRNIRSTCTKDDRQASGATCSKFRSRYRTLSTTTSRLLLYRAAGRCRIALLFSRSRGARALSACVFRGRRRAAGGCPCRTIFHCTPAARGRAPVLGIASGCFSRKRRLLQGPEELCEVRVDRPKSKVPSRSSYAATREYHQALF
jgi:hypothetical protein